MEALEPLLVVLGLVLVLGWECGRFAWVVAGGLALVLWAVTWAVMRREWDDLTRLSGLGKGRMT